MKLFLAAILLVATAVPASADFENLGRQVLGPRDGWGAGTTGGSTATRDHVYTVHNRSQLVTALTGDTPKIVYVAGTVDGNSPMTCDQYADPGYSLAAYLKQYDPATWGTAPVTGPLEEARARSQANQQARVVIPVGANTTIVGLGDDATLRGVNLMVRSDNVIIRNLRFEDAYDCFPQWDPNDGATGNWNSEYDNLTLMGATHVWVDHCEFSDGATTELPTYFGHRWEVHDGLFDMVNGTDLVTATYNYLHDHDKSMLLGNTDKPTYDVGKLRITLHHNMFENLGQRAPRVRYGQVHVYNNLYVIPDSAQYSYSLGVGVESRIYAENNFFETANVNPSTIVHYWKGTAIHATGTIVNRRPVDLVAAYNRDFDPDLATDVGWQPTLVTHVDPTIAVPRLVRDRAGVGRN
ncbi:pectate lyase [Actinocrispum sp. NPDC049592]|uniref:pectate lyase family protein n=1 Tax=Actinocrispum sp. NPDC049592 TaxID=3154835 RepID=UPI00342A1FBF